MSTRTFYRLSLFLPILLPAMLMALGARYHHVDSDLGEAVHFGGSYLLISALPYSVLIPWLAWWMRGKTEPDIRKMSYRIPILALPIYLVSYSCYLTIVTWQNPNLMRTLAGVLLILTYVICVGYLYALVVNGLLRLLKVLRAVRDDSQRAV